jgi:D-threonate/D-erythronate kinase
MADSTTSGSRGPRDQPSRSRGMDSSLRIGVIADDLTGAADGGVQLARAGYRTAVAFLGEPIAADGAGLDAVVADTDSRAVAAAAARARVRDATRAVAAAPILLKKIDSTLRGAIGDEVHAALDAAGRRLAVVAPAFPAAGRTTEAGVQLVDGAPVHRTRFATDPVSPVRESHLPTLLGGNGLGETRHVGAGDAAALADALGRARCVVADARTDADLEAIVRAVPDPSDVLWVGSAGLARALAAVHPGPGLPAEEPADEAEPRVLVVSGSANDVARDQVRRLVASGIPGAGLSLPALGGGATEACAALAARALRDAPACVVHPVGGGDGPDLPARIAAALGDVAERLSANGDVTALVLTGGETAVTVARRLGATGLRVQTELEPGVPVGRLLGPRPYRVVTKAGGFGSPEVLRRACEALAASERSGA